MRTDLIAIFSIALMSTSAFAVDTSKANHDPKHDPKSEEKMKAWMDYSTPSEAHKVLSSLAGKWKTTSKMWHTPDTKPEESVGTTTLRMVLGGRFLENKTTGKAMGMPFEGLGFIGYNNITKKYETLWLDNLATGMMRGAGSFDEKNQTLKDSGEFSCPMAKDKTQTYRSEWKIVDKNNLVFAMWSPDESGKEFKNMEMIFKRAK